MAGPYATSIAASELRLTGLGRYMHSENLVNLLRRPGERQWGISYTGIELGIAVFHYGCGSIQGCNRSICKTSQRRSHLQVHPFSCVLRPYKILSAVTLSVEIYLLDLRI